ncbi:hypothetical protein VP01_7746g1 [Puccinia sorghi]|uniref:Uncharacterized protein n=1 Tax=Puccinia sorghi TaxID=27349 RepID=A0A0L6UC94_9BASI|nr:hypothetical protein VP01_7746g1 [Puccinia sorghi]
MALVYGTVYVTEVCWDFKNKCENYVKVVDCSVGKVIPSTSKAASPQV